MVCIIMQFQVPQFIETEDKLIGPLTLKQFAYIAVGGLIVFFFYFVVGFFLWVILAGFIGLVVAALAFIQYNGRPFLILVLSMFGYFWSPRLYIWKAAGGEAIIKKPSKEDVGEGGISILGLKLNTFRQPLTERREKSARSSILDRWRTTKERFEVFRKLTGEKDVARRVDYR